MMAFEVRFDEVVQQHGADVLRICHSVLRDEHLGRDAAQEAFLRLWRSGPRACTAEQRAAWLKRVALTSAIDLSRRVRVRRREGRLDAATEKEAAPPARPERAAAAAELHARFDAALRGLPERQRAIFSLRHDARMPLKEIAALLDIEVTTVKTQFTRAVWKLQTKLAPFREEADDEA